MTLTLEYRFDCGDVGQLWGNATATACENGSGGVVVTITHAEIPMLGLRECKGMLSRVAIIDLEARFIELFHKVIERKEMAPDDYEREVGA
jgi:hypothetical protein